jgi:hypothetical protein
MTEEQRVRKALTDKLYRERSKEHVAEIGRLYYHSTLKHDQEYKDARKKQYDRYYASNVELLREKGRAHYQTLKDADPTFHNGKRGRPRKIQTLESAPPGKGASSQIQTQALDSNAVQGSAPPEKARPLRGI